MFTEYDHLLKKLLGQNRTPIFIRKFRQLEGIPHDILKEAFMLAVFMLAYFYELQNTYKEIRKGKKSIDIFRASS